MDEGLVDGCTSAPIRSDRTPMWMLRTGVVSRSRGLRGVATAIRAESSDEPYVDAGTFVPASHTMRAFSSHTSRARPVKLLRRAAGWRRWVDVRMQAGHLISDYSTHME